MSSDIAIVNSAIAFFLTFFYFFFWEGKYGRF
ncbi:MAG: hypothetical protein EBR05_10605 [Marivivens sp.]|nr:hypothetical protein [Marivivens sp.]NBT52825.1 hypothetical protein [Marivivens sp.]NBX10227.1 hypothetical protein [Marivivens sp.]NCW70000.1 hypothetical protein [Marivivens sp.]NDH03819.1 hypothetical protein [Marivivens sp.]